MLGPFKESARYSMGVELELQLIDLKSHNLIEASPEILKLLGDKSNLPGGYSPEMTQGMIEIQTDVHTNYLNLLYQLQDIRNVLLNVCNELGIGICGGGTHPFQFWNDRKICDSRRYRELYYLYGYLAKNFTVFGQHVHIGCSSGNEALYLLHTLNRFVPQFIALSASSPYINGVDTFFDSARLNSVFAFPLSGCAPFILDWDEFDNGYFAKMQKTGTIKTMKDFYWDIRPKPEYGTIELRVCDTPLTVTKAATLAVYLQMLCKYLLEDKAYVPEPEDYLVYNFNRFQACRFGLDGEIVDPKTHQKVALRDDIVNTIHKLTKHAHDLNGLAACEHLLEMMADTNDANYLREKFLLSNSIEEIVQVAINKFKTH